MKCTKWGIHPCFETRVNVTRNLKQEYLCLHKKTNVTKKAMFYILFIIFLKFNSFGQYCSDNNERNFLDNATHAHTERLKYLFNASVHEKIDLFVICKSHSPPIHTLAITVDSIFVCNLCTFTIFGRDVFAFQYTF